MPFAMKDKAVPVGYENGGVRRRLELYSAVKLAAVG